MLITLKGKHVHLSEAIHTYAEAAAEAAMAKYHLHPTSLKGTLDKNAEGLFELTLTAHLEKAWTERIEHSHKDPYKAVDSAFAALDVRNKDHKKRAVDHAKHHDNHHYMTKVKLAEALLSD